MFSSQVHGFLTHKFKGSIAFVAIRYFLLELVEFSRSE